MQTASSRLSSTSTVHAFEVQFLFSWARELDTSRRTWNHSSGWPWNRGYPAGSKFAEAYTRGLKASPITLSTGSMLNLWARLPSSTVSPNLGATSLVVGFGRHAQIPRRD